MQYQNVAVGKYYICQAVGLKGKVIGEVISKLERCCILYVKHHSNSDKVRVIDKASKVVVRYDDFICEA